MSTPIAGSLAATPLYTTPSNDGFCWWDHTAEQWNTTAPWLTAPPAGGPYLPLTGGTLTGALAVNAQIQTQGAGGAYFFADRTSGANWAWYADGGAGTLARLYSAGGGDRLTIDSAGNLTTVGQVIAGGTGVGYSAFTGGGSDNSNTHRYRFGWSGANLVFSVDGTTGIQLANASQLGNYLPLTGGTLTGNLYVPNSLVQANHARLGGLNVGGDTWAQIDSAFNGLANSGAMGVAWNYSAGGGEVDLFVNRDGGSTGGLYIYDFGNTSSAPVLLLRLDGTIGLTTPYTVSSTGPNAGLSFADRSGSNYWEWYVTANIARLYSNANGDRLTIDSAGSVIAQGYIRSAAEVQSTQNIAFRAVQGNYGAFWFNDGSNFYLLFTNSGDQYGWYNSLRPFHVQLSTGTVSMENGLVITAGGLNVAGGNVSMAGSLGAANFSINGTDHYIYDAGGGTLGIRAGVSGGPDGYFSMHNNGRFDCANLFLTGPYVYFSSGTGNVNSTGGPFIYADSANFVVHLGTGNNRFYLQDTNGVQRWGVDAAGDLYLNNSVVLYGDGLNAGYTHVFDNNAQTAIYLGNNSDQTNYYRQTNHRFQARDADGSGNFLSVNASGVQCNGTLWPSYNNAANFYLTADSSGNCFINFTSDGWRFEWRGSDGAFIFWAPGGTSPWYEVNGNTYQTGNVSAANVSDARTKRDVEPYTRGLADLVKLKPVSYRYNGLGNTTDDGELRYGLTAQDAQPFIPECVRPTHRMPRYGGDDPYLPDQLSLHPEPLTYALINAVRELSERLAAVEARP